MTAQPAENEMETAAQYRDEDLPGEPVAADPAPGPPVQCGPLVIDWPPSRDGRFWVPLTALRDPQAGMKAIPVTRLAVEVDAGSTVITGTATALAAADGKPLYEDVKWVDHVDGRLRTVELVFEVAEMRVRQENG